MIVAYPTEDLRAATWIDLLDPTADEVARVREATGLRVPDQHQVSEIESTSRLAFENGAYYLSTPLVFGSRRSSRSTAPTSRASRSRCRPRRRRSSASSR